MRKFPMMILVVMILVMPFLTGCWGGTPDPVLAGFQAETTMLEQVQTFYVTSLETQFENLKTMTNALTDTILNYEVRLQAENGAISLEKLDTLMQQYRAKRSEYDVKLEVIRSQIYAADATVEKIKTLHARMQQYLNKEQLDLKDVLASVTSVTETLSKENANGK